MLPLPTYRTLSLQERVSRRKSPQFRAEYAKSMVWYRTILALRTTASSVSFAVYKHFAIPHPLAAEKPGHPSDSVAPPGPCHTGNGIPRCELRFCAVTKIAWMRSRVMLIRRKPNAERQRALSAPPAGAGVYCIELKPAASNMKTLPPARASARLFLSQEQSEGYRGLRQDSSPERLPSRQEHSRPRFFPGIP